MSFSKSRRALRGLAALALVCSAAAPAAAEDGVVTLRESLFERFANALPLRLEEPYAALLCDSTLVLEVDDIDFEIGPDDVFVRAKLDGSWCGVPFDGTITTRSQISYVAEEQVLRFETESTSYRPSVYVFDRRIKFPFTVDLGGPLTLPDLPLGAARFELVRPGGGTLHIAADDLSLVQHPGRFELHGDVDLY